MAQDKRSKPEQVVDSLIQHHPLQRLQSPSRSISLLVHGLGLTSMTYSFSHLVLYPNHINSTYGWHFQYLTIIGLSLTTLTLLLAFLSDILLSPTIFRLKNLLITTTAPMSLLVTTLYFSLRTIDPALVVPPDMELPFLTDLSFHLTPTVFLLFDILFLSPPWTITVIPACIVSVGIALSYWAWVERCFARNGFYPYPIFDIVGFEGRVALFGLSAVSMVLGSIVLKSVQARVLGVRKTGAGPASGRGGAVPGSVKKGL